MLNDFKMFATYSNNFIQEKFKDTKWVILRVVKFACFMGNLKGG
jgi:hypothetical protein